MRPSLQADVDLAAKQGTLRPILVKNFNMWQSARADSYISLDDWEKAIIEPPDTMGKDVYIGLDLLV